MPPPPAPPIPVRSEDILLQDDFSVSRDGWGTLDDPESKVQYDNDALRMRLFAKNYVVWSRPNDNDYDNVHIEVTAINIQRVQDTVRGGGRSLLVRLASMVAGVRATTAVVKAQIHREGGMVNGKGRLRNVR